MTPRRASALASTACVSALLLSSCGLLQGQDENGDDTDPGADAPPEEPAEGDQTAGDDATGQDEGADQDEGGEADDAGPAEIVEAQDGSRAVPPEEAIASIEYELGGDDSVIVSVATLEETDEFLLMELYYWPQLEDEDDALSIFDMLGDQASNRPGPLPRIYDRENLKVYRAFHDNDTTGAFGRPSASDGNAIYWWGFFPLFEDDVETVDIEFATERPHLQDVPVTGAPDSGEED